MWLPATARATLPHTSVDATTIGERGCPGQPAPQPVNAVEPIRKMSADGAQPPG